MKNLQLTSLFLVALVSTPAMSYDHTVSGTNNSETLYAYPAGTSAVYGYDGSDTIYGYTGSDLLMGMNHIDTIYGYEGNDTIDPGNGGYGYNYGGDGNDTMLIIDSGVFMGEAGADIFRLAQSNGACYSSAIVTDFKAEDINSTLLN